MKFKIDENLPVEVVELLRKAGYDALTVTEQHLAGSSDVDIATISQREHRVLITLDLDFADIRAYPPGDFCGLLVLRLKQQDKFYVMRVIKRLKKMFEREPLEGRLWIVEEARVRIRE